MTVRRCASLLVAGVLAAGCASSTSGSRAAAGTPRPSVAATASRQSGPVPRTIGITPLGRPLRAFTLGAPDSPRRLLVVGCIHGDEAAGVPIAQALLRLRPVPGTELVLVPDANPDGRIRATRQNAHGVDLNRNFPYRWQPIGRPGDQQYSGPGPLSEPESRALAALVRQVRPTVSVWFHHPVGVVDLSGGSAAVEQRFAAVAGLPVRQLVRYPGSATGWQDAGWPGTTAFVVELPRPVPPGLAGRVLQAVRDLES